MNKVKVLVVDDSILFRKVLIDQLSQYDHIEVVGYATDAFDAKEKIPKLNPHVVTLDVEMPKLNGIDFLKQLIPTHPVPVVLVSALNISVFEALSAGAVDFVRKPAMQAPNAVSQFISELVTKISIASIARVQVSNTNKALGLSLTGELIKTEKSNSMVIALGASTGGTEATLKVLKDLPLHTPGILVTQHMPAGFTAMYAERLNKLCVMNVKEARTGDKAVPGQVLIAPGDSHMRLMRAGSDYIVRCTPGEKVSGHCPSVDVLFDSVASVAKSNAVGIIMTGMGKDGAEGLLNMKKQGAYTIGQSKESCVVYGMPMVAYNIGAVSVQAPCEEIANLLKKYLNKL